MTEVDGALAAILVFGADTDDETLRLRGKSGEDLGVDGAENKDVGESVRGGMSFNRLSLSGPSRQVNSIPLLL